MGREFDALSKRNTTAYTFRLETLTLDFFLRYSIDERFTNFLKNLIKKLVNSSRVFDEFLSMIKSSLDGTEFR